jgi:hypothetical protein
MTARPGTAVVETGAGVLVPAGAVAAMELPISRLPLGPARWLASAAVGGGVDGLQDHVRDDAGVGDHGEVRGVHFGDVGVRLLGHGQLQRRRTGVVGGACHGPRRDRLPGWDTRRVGEGARRIGSRVTARTCACLAGRRLAMHDGNALWVVQRGRHASLLAARTS